MKPESIKHAMYYGLLLGVVFIANFALSLSGNAVLQALQWLVMCAIPWLVYAVARKCRDELNGGVMSYGQALWYGIQLFFYASLVSSAFKYFYFRFINPEFLKNLFNQTMTLMEQLKMPVTDELYEATKSLMTPIDMALQYIWVNVMIGFFVSLVVAFFVRKNKSIFEK